MVKINGIIAMIKAFDKWLLENADPEARIKQVAIKLRPYVAKIAQDTYSRMSGRKGIGLCSYIAEKCVKQLSPILRQHGLAISEYFGPEGFKPLSGRDHVSLALYDPENELAVELDLPEEKYQRRLANTYGFEILPGVQFSPNDVILKWIRSGFF